MSHFNLKNYVVRILFFLIGCFIIQLGVAFFIKSETGVDSFTIFMQGLANLLHITVGQANILVMGIVFIGMLIFTREYIRLGTFLAVISAGPFLDLINNWLVDLNLVDLHLVVRLIIVAISCIVIAIGFSILKSAELSVAPTDQLPLIIVDKTGWQYKWVRITMDIIFIIIGFSLGGDLWLGTIVTTLLIGPCIQYFLPIIEKKVAHIIPN
ncbi:MAG: membrane protein [Turicibacter sp.]|nr:membrane protein [Turicibacter sp.]